MRCSSCGSENSGDSRFCSQCAAPLTPFSVTPTPDGRTLVAAFENLERGTLFAGRYEIIEELGKGGMGSVYKAFDQKLREVVALKIIKPEIGFNTAAIERFKNELKNARKIAHRNVCRLYDLGEAGLVHFLTMEYVEGEDLKKFIRRAGPIGAGRAAAIARQVAEGLAEAHREGVVHRDLKPQNIMIDHDGRARIMDFGLSRFLEADGVTGSGVMLGTPEYMSPEQVEMREVDGRSDLYAVGIILFEMVTGKVPFEGQTPLAVAIKHKNEAPPDARDTNPLVPEPLVRIIYRCLQKDPADRYPNAQALADDLAALEGDLPTLVREMSSAQAKPAPPPPKAVQKKARRKSRRTTFLIVLLGLLFIPPLYRAVQRLGEQGIVGAAPKGSVRAAAESEDANGPSSIVPGPGREGFNPADIGKAREMIIKYSESADPKDLAEANKLIGTIKDLLPEKGPYVEAWNNLSDEISRHSTSTPPSDPRTRRSADSRTGAARTSSTAMQGDMETLMAMVAERDAAFTARNAMGAAKAVAQKTGADDKNVLFRLARYEEGNAEDAFQKNDYSGAKALFRVLEKTFNLVTFQKEDAAGIDALKQYVAGLKAEAAAAKSGADPWLLQIAGETETEAGKFLAGKDLANAGGAYLRAAFLYQKIKDTAPRPR
ncbi:MAG: serine/threonine protein kinase [Acidobacteriota bacterium]|nr:serine/threonine protein kinase [Acidobacteriota bacterium]